MNLKRFLITEMVVQQGVVEKNKLYIKNILKVWGFKPSDISVSQLKMRDGTYALMVRVKNIAISIPLLKYVLDKNLHFDDLYNRLQVVEDYVVDKSEYYISAQKQIDLNGSVVLNNVKITKVGESDYLYSYKNNTNQYKISYFVNVYKAAFNQGDRYIGAFDIDNKQYVDKLTMLYSRELSLIQQIKN